MKEFFNTVSTWRKNKDYLSLGIFLLAIIVLLELTVFNYKFYTNVLNEPLVVAPKLNGAIERIDETTLSFGSGNKSLELLNLNTKVKNIYIDMEIKDDANKAHNDVIKVKIEATDAGNAKYFSLPDRYIVKGNIASKQIPINLNGDTSKIKINILDCDNKTVTLNTMAINGKVAFSFNVIRIIALWLIVALIYIINPKNGFYKYVFNPKSKKQNTLSAIIIVINVAVILFLGIANPNTTINESSHHNQYNELAESIMSGHFYLDETPAPALVAMENPYDRRLRDEVVKGAGQKYKWDTAYYQGKYYVYFGVVPELLFFLPANLMGFDLINKIPVIIMLMLAVIFGYLLIRELTIRYAPKTKFLVYLMLSAIFVNSIGIYLGIRIPDLYMLPLSHALAFSIMAFYFYIKALPEKEGDMLKTYYILGGSITMALVAGCRPQVIISGAVLIPLYWKYIFKDRLLFSKKSINTTILFVIPYVVVAGFLMFYNFARFGNVFDFGANYNLTTMDMVSEKFNISKIPLGIFTYFFQPPSVSATFPFIRNVAVDTNLTGNYVREFMFGGIIPCNIILVLIFMLSKVKDNLKVKEISNFVYFSIAFSFIIAIIDYNIGGIVLRYTLDFVWLMFIAAILIFYCLEEKAGNSSLLYRFLPIAFSWSMIYQFMLFFNINSASYREKLPRLFAFVKHSIEFWV